LVDEEVRRLTTKGHEQAGEIIRTHREQHRIIAEALLKYETLDEKQILSLFKTGKMPDDDSTEIREDHATTFEESKRELERKEAQRQSDLQAKDDTQDDDSNSKDE
jgi:cell division protease FtsH